MNPVYAGIRQTPMATDSAGHVRRLGVVAEVKSTDSISERAGGWKVAGSFLCQVEQLTIQVFC